MFITSIGGFGNNNSSTSTTTTVPSGTSIGIAQGYVNATVSGYKQDVHLNTTGLSPSGNASLTSMLQTMENNHTISYYTSEQNGFYVSLSTISPYGLQEYLSSNTVTSNVIMSASALLTLPKYINLSSSRGELPIASPLATQSVSISPLLPINSTIKLFAMASVVESSSGYSVYYNGTAYQMELKVVSQ